MKKHEIHVGGRYLAKVSGKLTTVRVDAIVVADFIRGTRYHITNLATGRKTTFRSAAKFRSPVRGLSGPTSNLVDIIDKSKRPKIYRTSNPEHYQRICVDFYPASVPTIASFPDVKTVSLWLSTMFGREQFETWFPGGIRERKPDCGRQHPQPYRTCEKCNEANPTTANTGQPASDPVSETTTPPA